MRTLVLGDIHGHKAWKSIVNSEEYDNVVFLGDYLDAFRVIPEDIANNLLDIIKFKEKMGDKCRLCYGNHDHSYWNDERCSGYNWHGRHLYMPLLEDMFRENMLDLIYIQDDIIFSHAGVSEFWMRNIAGFSDPKDITFENIEEQYAGKVVGNCIEVKDTGLDLLNWNAYAGYDGYGNTISQSPIWIRPQSLLKSKVDGYRQIVGHTNMGTPVEEDGVYFNDLLPEYYIIVEDGNISFVKNEFK